MVFFDFLDGLLFDFGAPGYTRRQLATERTGAQTWTPAPLHPTKPLDLSPRVEVRSVDARESSHEAWNSGNVICDSHMALENLEGPVRRHV